MQRFQSTVGSHIRAHSDRKSTRLNSSHTVISYAVFCLKKKKASLPSYPYCRITQNGSTLYHVNDTGSRTSCSDPRSPAGHDVPRIMIGRDTAREQQRNS